MHVQACCTQNIPTPTPTPTPTHTHNYPPDRQCCIYAMLQPQSTSGVHYEWTLHGTCRESLCASLSTLSFRLPVGGGSGGSTATSRLHLGFLKGDDSVPEIKLSTEEMIVMCTLVCTADYCVDTTQQVLCSVCDGFDTDVNGCSTSSPFGCII